MPFMDGRAFLRGSRTCPQAEGRALRVPLGRRRDDRDRGHATSGGPTTSSSKPFNMARLLAKVRAMLRMAERRHDALSGPVGPAGTLPLLKFCEDSRLVGPALRHAPGQEAAGPTSWAASSSAPAARRRSPAEEPLDAAAGHGGGHVPHRAAAPRPRGPAAQRHRKGRGAGRAPAAEAGAGLSVPVPAGRLSMIRVRGQDIQVQTEGENRPEFTVTTVVARDGQVMRKMQSAWHHPFKRREDQEVARTQIDRQHDRVVAMLQGLAAEAAPVPVPTAPAAALGVDPSLLAWALSFVAEQVRDHLGAVMTLALLRRQPAARGARAGRRCAPSASRRTAGWCRPRPRPRCPRPRWRPWPRWTADFLSSAGEIVDRAGAIRAAPGHADDGGRAGADRLLRRLRRGGVGRSAAPVQALDPRKGRLAERQGAVLDRLGHRRLRRPHGPQQLPEHDALERGLAVDAVVVGAAEHELRHLADAAAAPRPPRPWAGAGRGRWRASAGRRRPRTWPRSPSCSRARIAAAGPSSPAPRRAPAWAGSLRPAASPAPGRASRACAPGPRGSRARGGGPPPGTAGAAACPRPCRSGGAPRPGRRVPTRIAPRSRCRADPRPAAPGRGRGARGRPRAAAAGRPTACAR